MKEEGGNHSQVVLTNFLLGALGSGGLYIKDVAGYPGRV